jgi:hypothetical protein
VLPARKRTPIRRGGDRCAHATGVVGPAPAGDWNNVGAMLLLLTCLARPSPILHSSAPHRACRRHGRWRQFFCAAAYR